MMKFFDTFLIAAFCLLSVVLFMELRATNRKLETEQNRYRELRSLTERLLDNMESARMRSTNCFDHDKLPSR
jgi:hypothetical protein